MGVGCCLCPPRMINSCGGIFPRLLLCVDGKQAPNGADRRSFFRARLLAKSEVAKVIYSAVFIVVWANSTLMSVGISATSNTLLLHKPIISNITQLVIGNA